MRARTREQQAEIDRLVRLLNQAQDIRYELETLGAEERVVDLYCRAYRREKRRERTLVKFVESIQ